MKIRPARAEDAAAITPLLLLVLEAMELPFLARHGMDTTRRLLVQAMAEANYRYGHAHGLVHTIDGRIAGAAFGYPAEEEAHVDHPFSAVLAAQHLNPLERLFTESEAFAGEWYLDLIAVLPEHRSHGIGAALINALPAYALACGKNRIGLNVDENNHAAQRLYSRLGYKTVGSRDLARHRYYHMQKKLG